MTKQHIKQAQKRTQRRDTEGRSLWYLIAASIGVTLVMSLFGLIDWTPRQAYVPTQDEPVQVEQLQQAVEKGELRLGN